MKLIINEEKAKKIADCFPLKNGVIVHSGTIALLSALKLSSISVGDYVLINGYCCYSLFEAILNVGAIPVFVIPKNFFSISLEEVEKAVNEYPIKCFIAAHQYGIVQNIQIIREKFPDLVIIEDIAQAWNVVENCNGIGAYSDYVVTSFGKSKELSYGQAGAIFSNYDLSSYFDFHDKNSRGKSNYLLPFALYECQDIPVEDLVVSANEIVNHQREVSKYLTNYFEHNPNVSIYRDQENQLSSWHKFPVVIKNLDYVEEFERIMEENHILYQWQNYLEVWELGMVKSSNYFILENRDKERYALIRTRQNSLEDVKKLVR